MVASLPGKAGLEAHCCHYKKSRFCLQQSSPKGAVCSDTRSNSGARPLVEILPRGGYSLLCLHGAHALHEVKLEAGGTLMKHGDEACSPDSAVQACPTKGA